MRAEHIETRLATGEDEPMLWIALAWAAHMPGDGSSDDVQAARTEPALAVYAENFGTAGDVGVIALEAGTHGFVGAAWLRPIRAYAFVRENVPELAIGVDSAWRGHGVGGRLMRELLEAADSDYAATCLSVRRENPAVRLYERLGYEMVPGSVIENRVGGESITMLRTRP